MFRTFFPDEYLDSTYEIDFEKIVSGRLPWIDFLILIIR